jgi:hypothetical protein
MEMPLPDNTFPMMTGQGPFGPIEMGGMFTTFKVRSHLGANDYRDPGWYRHPKGTVAYEWQGAPLDAQAPRRPHQARPRCCQRAQTRIPAPGGRPCALKGRLP